MTILRKCRQCGLEAKNEKDLELFAIGSKNKFGRRNLCKKCRAKEAREYRKRRWDDLGLCRKCGKPSDRNTSYCSKCLKKMSIYNRKRHWELRLRAILKLGGKCIICGMQDFRVLTINHKEGRNYRTTIDKGDKFYHSILSGERKTDDLEVRCYNCNALYEFEMGYRKVPENLDLSIISQFEKVNKMTQCVRCGSTKSLEKDHIIPKSRGGTDEDSNKRLLCTACHAYRHARDKIIHEIDRYFSLLGTKHFNSIIFTMWIMRLGVIEAFNTPTKIKKRGTYKKYWDVPTTHYSAWYPQIKLAKENRLKGKQLIKKLEDFGLLKIKER